jgi:hypothetical protein
MGHRGPRPPEYRGQAKVSTEERKRSILNRENFGERTARAPEEKGKQLLNGLRPRRVTNYQSGAA